MQPMENAAKHCLIVTVRIGQNLTPFVILTDTGFSRLTHN
jgi:hypothetical protein